MLSISPFQFVTLLSLIAHAYCSIETPLVKTTSGTVRGFYPHSSIRAFLGIPYAEPPLGSLRFKPPKPLGVRAGEIDATEFGYSCVQFHTEFLSDNYILPTTGESEDCLTLNIWTSAESSLKLKPVFVWVYGGGFTDGSTSIPLYNGIQLVKNNQDIIVVTLNYRVNIFGFANSPGLPEKNAGLRDQRLAIEWLRDNIKSFGGDPARMVLGGQSAGSMSVGLYAYAYPNDPIVQAFIMESGQPEMRSGDDGSQWISAANQTGCRSDNSAYEFECMQKVNARVLRRTLSPANVNSLSDPAFSNPAVDNITFFGREAYPALGAAGKFAKLPTLRGSNDDDGIGTSPFNESGPLNQTFTDFVNLVAFNCPTAVESRSWALNNVTSWRYRYMGKFPSLSAYPWTKAYHGAELPLVFGSTKAVQVEPPTAYEREAALYLQKAWVSFIKNPHTGLTQFGWPQYNPNDTTLVELFTNNTSTAHFVDPLKYDLPCQNLLG